MDFLFDLWIPILASAAAVFVVSSIVHLALPIHKNDYASLPDEETILAALRDQQVGPGEYSFPFTESMQEMQEPATIEKYSRGPVGFLTVMPSGPPGLHHLLPGDQFTARGIPAHRHGGRSRLCSHSYLQLDQESPALDNDTQEHLRRNPLRPGHRSNLCQPGQLGRLERSLAVNCSSLPRPSVDDRLGRLTPPTPPVFCAHAVSPTNHRLC